MAINNLRLLKNPGLYVEQALVKVEVQEEVDKKLSEEIKEQFMKKTGYEIELN